MAFPYTFSKTMTFEDQDYWIQDIPENFHQLLIGAFQNKGYEYEDKCFSSNQSLFSIPFKFGLKTELSPGKLQIKYRLTLQNLVNGMLVILLLSAFFSRFEFQTFLWFSFLISAAFYQLSLIIIRTGIKKEIKGILKAYKRVKAESDIENWVRENGRDCPACGTRLSNSSLFCDHCGLKVRQNAYTKPLNLNQVPPKVTVQNHPKTSKPSPTESQKPVDTNQDVNAASYKYHYKKDSDDSIPKEE